MDNTPLSTSPQSRRSPTHLEIADLEPLPTEAISSLFPRLPGARGTAKWFWLIGLASLGLHGVMLFLPLGEPETPPPPKPPEAQVRITQLPNRMKPPAIKRPPPTAIRRSPQSTSPRLRPHAPAVPRVSAPPPPAIAAAKPDPTAARDTWKDFPLYPGSTPGCFELASCLQSQDGFSQVADHFATQLPARKYAIKPVVQTAERRVYEVTREGLTQFLSILANGKNAVYVLSDAPRTIADLEKAVEVPPEIYAILVGLAVQQADASAFAQPNQFYTTGDRSPSGSGLVPKPGIRNISLVAGQAADTMMDEFLRSNLQNSDFTVIDLPKTYGGGKVYQAQKDGKTLYLNLVPTKDNSSTLLVIWNTPPS